ncbi:MAG: flagellar protein FlgN [Clostridiales bacterium]|jgi:flagellar biosynthesis/type III secretory pathway chaperone|nr:flagellar protein FlgN [Clostridiales bacterium]
MQALLDILSRQSGCYSELIGLAKRKKALIVQDNIDEMRNITARENGILTKIQKSEKERMEQVNALTKHKGSIANMGEFLELLPESFQKKELIDLRMKIRRDMDELKALNNENRELLERSLQYVDFSLNLLRSAITGPSFAEPKESTAITARPTFDARG